MDNISSRQKQILKAIIEEYIETAQPVGSETLEKKHSLGVSPATIRNEMMVLTRENLLRQPHSSSGRIPTPIGFKLYIQELMEEQKMSVADEVSAKEKIWDSRHSYHELLEEAVHSLASRTHYLAVAATKEGDLFHSGYANILDMPEFFDIDVTRSVLSALEEFNQINSWFQKSYSGETVHYLLGEELGADLFSSCGLVFSQFSGSKHSGAIGVIGPSRLDFPRVIPQVRYLGELLSDILGQW